MPNLIFFELVIFDISPNFDWLSNQEIAATLRCGYPIILIISGFFPISEIPIPVFTVK